MKCICSNNFKTVANQKIQQRNRAVEAVQGMFCNKNVALVSHFAWFCMYNLLVAYVASSGTESGVGEFVSSANKHTLGDVESTTIGVGTSRSIPAGSQDHFQLTNEYGETKTVCDDAGNTPRSDITQ